MKPGALLFYNLWKRPLVTAVTEAAAAHLRRLGTAPTNVILPLGDWPATVGGLVVETCKTVDTNHMKVYDSEALNNGHI